MNSSDKSVKILAMFDEEKVLVKKLDSLLGQLTQTEKENLYYNDEPIIFSTLFQINDQELIQQAADKLIEKGGKLPDISNYLKKCVQSPPTVERLSVPS